MIAASNKRIFVTVESSSLDFLKKIVEMYNRQCPESPLIKQTYGIKKLSVSALYKYAIDNLIIRLGQELDVNKSLVENEKAIFNFLCPSEKYKI